MPDTGPAMRSASRELRRLLPEASAPSGPGVAYSGKKRGRPTNAMLEEKRRLLELPPLPGRRPLVQAPELRGPAQPSLPEQRAEKKAQGPIIRLKKPLAAAAGSSDASDGSAVAAAAAAAAKTALPAPAAPTTRAADAARKSSSASAPPAGPAASSAAAVADGSKKKRLLEEGMAAGGGGGGGG